MNRLKFLAAALLLGATWGLAWTTGAAAQDTGKIVLGWTADLQTAPLVVAMEKGFMKEAGLEVKSVRFVSGRDALEALLGGQLDLAFMAEYPPVIGVLRKQDFRVVSTLSRYYGNRIISTAKVGFTSMKDLAGKKIGTTLGSNAAFFTQVLLSKSGIKATVVNVAPADIVPALARGDIDAGVPFPDFYPKAQQVLGKDYREEISKDYVATFVISATTATIDKRPGDLKKFLSGLIKGDEFLHAHPEEAQEVVIKAMKGIADANHVTQGWSEYKYRVGLDKPLLDLLLQEADWIVQSGMIKDAKADPAVFRSYLADAPMKALAPERVELP